MKRSIYRSPATGGLAHVDVRAAMELFNRYRNGKSRLDARLWEEAAWWHSRHGVEGWGGGPACPDGQASHHSKKKPSSAWLFSGVCNKHADLCDALPTCVALPREPDDEAEAALLTDILPIISARCDFPEIYSANAWSKLKHGVAAYGIFWNPLLENGVGDIDIRRVDVHRLFWEPGVQNIQDSPHLFLVREEDCETLMTRYPAMRERMSLLQDEETLRTPALVGGYPACGESGSLGTRMTVVDWYYKRRAPDGRTILHYAKIAGDTLLYASENDPAFAARGWYDHGLYPIVLDVLYPEEGSPAGYGLIAVGRDPQGYIDELDGHILEYANHASRVRYWAKRSLGINEREFLDPDKRIIEVEGDIDEEKLRQITLSPMDGMLCEIRRMKIDELKETSGNRDVTQGVPEGGVTAASAIVSLQEAGNKSSRDMIAGSYRAYIQIMRQVIELIRQFYDGVRCFRVPDRDGGRHYVRYSHAGLLDKPAGMGGDGEVLYRHPLFDIEVHAERKDPADAAGRNQLMLELFRAGMFDPAHASEAERALSGMSFEGVDSLRAMVRRGMSPPPPPSA